MVLKSQLRYKILFYVDKFLDLEIKKTNNPKQRLKRSAGFSVDTAFGVALIKKKKKEKKRRKQQHQQQGSVSVEFE